ncbi:MAG TPA: asparaginase [Spirochaetota bacterium]|nr:asparaginase [Spirochaetota bacterium]
MPKKILLLSTGGTIASENTPDGKTPSFDADKILTLVGDVGSLCEVDTHDLMRIDSSNMQPEDWKTIARASFDGLEDYDGVVISHGTHTMAYTASALTFMLQNIDKPVVLTGAQVPAGEEGSDAEKNIKDSLLFAGEGIPGVFIVFGSKVIKGCRASKTSTVLFDAFESINYPLIAKIQDKEIVYRNKPSRPKKNPQLIASLDSRVLLLRLVPGTPPALLDIVDTINCRGLVLECFGAGGVPSERRNLVPKIRSLIDRGTIVAITTQCLTGGVDLTVYDVGRKSLRAGALSGLDMTTEALVTKLMWALGQSTDRDTVLNIMTTNFADEFTPGYKIRVT